MGAAATLVGWVLAAGPSGAAAGGWKECQGAEGSVVRVDGVQQTPDPAPKGSDMRVDITGASAADVPGGQLDVVVLEMGIPFYEVTYDLCKWVACPLAEGPVDIAVQVSVPAHLPSGKYDVKLQGTGTDGDLLFCGVTDLDIGGGGEQGEEGGTAWNRKLLGH